MVNRMGRILHCGRVIRSFPDVQISENVRHDAAITKTSRWLVVLVPGVLLYVLPLPALNPSQRHLLAIFTASVISLVAQPVAMGVTALVALTVLALTRTLSPSQVFSGYSNPTVWLIFTAFLFATAVTSTRFGMRVAYLFIRRFGRRQYAYARVSLQFGPWTPTTSPRRRNGPAFPRQTWSGCASSGSSFPMRRAISPGVTCERSGSSTR